MPSSWLNVGSAWSSRVVNVYAVAARAWCDATGAACATPVNRASAPLPATAAARAPAIRCFLMTVTPCLQAQMVPIDPAPPRTGWISFAPAACPGDAYRNIRDKHGYTTDRVPNHHGTGAGCAWSGRLSG